MTTNDSTYEDRLARLEGAAAGDTVTIPDGWTPPENLRDAADKRWAESVRPGCVFTHDGSDDGVPWKLDDPSWRRNAHARKWAHSGRLAKLGLDVDAEDVDSEEHFAERRSVVREKLRALPSGSVLELDPPRGFPDEQLAPPLPDGFKAHRLVKSGARRFDVTGGPDGGPLEEHVMYALTVATLGVTADDFDEPVDVDDSDDDGSVYAAGHEPDDDVTGVPAGDTDEDTDTPALRRTGRDAAAEESRITYNHVHVAFEGDAPAEAPAPDDDVTGVPAGETDEDGNAREHCTCSVCDPSEGETGVVYVEVAPKVDTAKWSAALRKAAEQVPQVPLLDEYQLERVAALEHSLRILESRKTSKGGGGIADLFRSSAMPATAVQDMIDVAAFIAESDTGRIGEVQA